MILTAIEKHQLVSDTLLDEDAACVLLDDGFLVL
jgi:hypothetical protein